MVGARRKSHVAPLPDEMDRDLFFKLCAKQGAMNEQERADLVDVNRNTVNRWLKGKTSPLLSVARATARKLETSVDELWPEGGAQ